MGHCWTRPDAKRFGRRLSKEHQISRRQELRYFLNSFRLWSTRGIKKSQARSVFLLLSLRWLQELKVLIAAIYLFYLHALPPMALKFFIYCEFRDEDGISFGIWSPCWLLAHSLGYLIRSGLAENHLMHKKGHKVYLAERREVSLPWANLLLPLPYPLKTLSL